MDSVSREISFRFEDLRLDHGRVPVEPWALLLWIVGEFSIKTDQRVVYMESEFCVVEFAAHAVRWLKASGGPRPDFVYDSMESDESGLVWIRQVRGGWYAGSVHDPGSADGPFSFGSVRSR
jgi:hypothetical protein